MRALNCTKAFVAIFILLSASFSFAWEVDFSRRQKDLKSLSSARSPASEEVQILNPSMVAEPPKLLEDAFKSTGPMQEIVILNTDKGFVPETVRLRKDGSYKITIVNVNEKEKNTSFVLDAFSEHHGTYFGAVKSFELMPKTSGIFSFVCPETAAQGRLVIFGSDSNDRLPASE